MSTISTFHRSAGDAKLGGVCGGVAERWGLDPVLVRVGFVLLALIGGVGVVLYLAGWLLLPVAGTGRATVDDLFGGAAARWPRELWITVVVVACILSFAVFGAVSPFGIVPALALLAVWWFGYRRPHARRDREARAGRTGTAVPATPSTLASPTPVPWSEPPTPFTQAAAAWQARVQEVQEVQEVQSGRWGRMPLATPTPTAAPTWPAAPTPAPAPAAVDVEQRARAAFLAEPDPVGLYTEPAAVPAVRAGSTLAARRLRLVAVSALGLTWLGLGIADALGVAVGLAVYAGAGLLVVALGLVAATRWGRARGLLPAGVALAVAAVAAAGFWNPTLSAPADEVTRGMFGHPVAYTSATAFPVDGDRLDVGSLDVDLTGLTLTSDATYRADVDTGRVLVRTPPGTGVVLRYTVDTGDVRAYGGSVGSGSDLAGERVLVPPAQGQRTLTLELRIDTGVIEVRA